MTRRFVLDASVILAWALGEPESSQAATAILLTLRKGRGLVPALWTAEIANALLVKERQRRIDERSVGEILDRIRTLPIDVDPDPAGFAVFDCVAPLAKRHQLSVYDAFYLELAVRQHLPLASFDSALVAAAQREGVNVLAG